MVFGLSAGLSMGVAGCDRNGEVELVEDEGALEEAGEAVDEGLEEAGEEIEDAGEWVEEEVED